MDIAIQVREKSWRMALIWDDDSRAWHWYAQSFTLDWNHRQTFLISNLGVTSDLKTWNQTVHASFWKTSPRTAPGTLSFNQETFTASNYWNPWVAAEATIIHWYAKQSPKVIWNDPKINTPQITQKKRWKLGNDTTEIHINWWMVMRLLETELILRIYVVMQCNVMQCSVV